MINIFFSYTSADRQKVEQAQKFFEADGQIVIWDFQRDSNYLREIPQNVFQALHDADYFFLFWSENASKNSAWITREFNVADEIEKELHNAGDRNSFVSIIKLNDAVDLPSEMKGRRFIVFNQSEFIKLKTEITKAGPRNKTQPHSSQIFQSISKVMTPRDRLLLIKSTSRLEDAFIQMETADIRHLIVVDEDGETLVGIISHRDIRKRIPPKLAEIKKVDVAIDVIKYQKAIAEAVSTPINQAMTSLSQIIYLNENANIQEALKKLLQEYDFGRISALPVVSENQVIGLISYFDLLCKLDIPDKNVGSSKKHEQLFSLNVTDTLGRVQILMRQAGIRHIPILDNNDLVGLIDDVTILWLLHPLFDLHDYPVGNFMQPIERIRYLRDEEKLIDVVDRLFCIDKKITALPVVDDSSGFKKLTGILSYIDILRAIHDFS